MIEAHLYDKLDGDRVACRVCAHRCTIQPGRRGVCGVRENRGGALYALTYGRLIAQAVDPIEKKPLFHFYPGSSAYSIASAGCNLRCSFCQNWEISQMPRDAEPIAGRETPPGAVVSAARRYGCRSIAYTYTEPAISFEYASDVSVPARQAGLANVFITNGYMTPDLLAAYYPYLDAANVDLKSFDDGFYRRLCGARLAPVLDALKQMKQQGVWLEVTTLVIPGHNDDPAELAELAAFIARELGAGTPWHVSRFHPDHRLSGVPPTPATTLRRAYDIGRAAGLRYVYIGNLPGLQGEDTLCPHCGETAIARRGFAVTARHTQAGSCTHCGTAIDGVGM